jgi:hypothetical protein
MRDGRTATVVKVTPLGNDDRVRLDDGKEQRCTAWDIDEVLCSHLPARCASCDRQACLNCRERIEPELEWEKTMYVIGDCTVCAPRQG